VSIYILNSDYGNPAESIIISQAIKSLHKIKQRKHEFLILTCYVDLNLVEDCVERLLNSFKLSRVRLAFNFSEIYKIGPSDTNKKLKEIQANLKKKRIDFECSVLAYSKLVHSKGYALIQEFNGVISGGVALTTSANFTRPGFQGENIEIGYLSSKKTDLNNFKKIYEYICGNLGTELIPSIFKEQEYLLKFSILSSGVFLHKWSGNLKQEIGIKYDVTPFVKEQGAIPPPLKDAGFERDDTTFTRQVLKVDTLPSKEIPPSFIKQFTIETYWGRWCPIDAWEELRRYYKGANQFINEFHRITEESALLKVKEEAQLTQQDLIEKGLIKKVEKDHLDRWENKIQDMRSNQRRLEKFFTGYDAHKLPYTIEQKTAVEELFVNLMEAVDLSKAINTSKKKLLSAQKKFNPDILSLTEEEIRLVREMIDNNP